MTPSLSAFLSIFLLFDAAALIFLIGYLLHRRHLRGKIRHFGDRAEEQVKNTILEEFPRSVLLNNVFFKTDTGTTQIDHILLCKWGVFVIETKSHNGQIRTGEKEWIQIYSDKIVRFHSPLLQNEIHRKAVCKALQKSRATRNIPVEGVVVFTSKKVYFDRLHPGVLRLEELGPWIKNGGEKPLRGVAITAKRGQRYLSEKTIQQIEKCLRKNSVRSLKSKKRHEKTVRQFDRNGYFA